jgi:hypothetical protein
MRRRTSQLALLALVGSLAVLVAPPTQAAPTWLEEKWISDPLRTIDRPQVATDSKGNSTAVWPQSNGSTWVIQASRRPAGGSWSKPVPLSDDTGDALSPDVAVDAKGRVTVVWYRFDGTHHVIEATSRPAGGSWSEPVDVSEDDNDAYDPRISVAPSGTVTAVWHGTEGALSVVRAASRAPGSPWTEQVDVSAMSANLATPRVAVDPKGRATAVWSLNAGPLSVVQASSRGATGGWSEPDDLSDVTKSGSSPQVAVDAAGNATVVWQQSTGAGAVTQTARRPLGGSWSEAKTLSAMSVDAYLPQLAVDRNGNATAVWYTYDGIEYIVEAATRRAGRAWSGKVEISRTGSSFDPQVAMDRRGVATAAWFEFAGDGNYVLVATRRALGRSWADPVEVSTDDHPAGPGLDLAVDPAGDIAAAWDIESAPAFHTVGAAGLDVAGPAILAFKAPRTGRPGARIAFSVRAKDTWAGTKVVRWKLGDGTKARGKSVTHVYARPGSYRVTVTLTDKVGNTTTRSRTITIRR